MEVYIPSFIKRIVERHVNLIVPIDDEAAIMPGGQNGPYFDVETPVRNTAHWLISFSIYYYFTGENQYRVTAQKLLAFLLKPKAYERNGVYVHRQKAGKDWSNGVIGQAWVGEALYVAGTVLENPEALAKAKSCLNLFEFDTPVGAWYRIDAANRKQAIDYTLNHQLWYAAVKAEAVGQACFGEIDAFLSTLNNGAFKIRNNGLINHLYHSSSIKGRLLSLRYKLMEKRNPEAIKTKEIGYHLFNIYPLARLYKMRPAHSFFSSAKFLKAVEYTTSERFVKGLTGNKYSYEYNSPAFEMPLALETFCQNTSETQRDNLIKKLLKVQKETTYDPTISILTNAADPITLTARVYEFLLGMYLYSRA